MPYQRYKPDFPKPDSRLTRSLNTQLLYITHSCYDKKWQSVMHAHPFTEVFFVVNGTGKFQVEDKTFFVGKDDLIIINPNIMHTEFNHGKEALEYIILGLDGLLFLHSGQAQSDYRIYNLPDHRTEILFYLKSILQELQQKKEHYTEVCQDLLEILLLLLMRDTKSTLDCASIDKASRECRFIEQYLDEHFTENITLEMLSGLTYMNKYYMVHAFKKYKGISPINYLISRRLSEARHLLETTDYPIAKIAQAAGFSSQSYFSQVFRKELNITPAQYRKQADGRS